MKKNIPLWLKIVYSIMVCIIVPVYWKEYGPTNFLWFSDIALISMVAALWFENRLIASMMAVGVLAQEVGWLIDLFTGGNLLGLAKYMFDPERPLYLRALSFFHIPMPIVIIYMIYKLGYENAHYCFKQYLPSLFCL